MTIQKTFRTISQRIQKYEDIKEIAKFDIGDYVEVYYGPDSGRCFTIADLVYNFDYNYNTHRNGSFVYCHDGFLGKNWYGEEQIVLRKKMKNKSVEIDYSI
jgi:hypothetical protein